MPFTENQMAAYLRAHTTLPHFMEGDFSDAKDKMSCGPLVGSLLQYLIRVHQPRRILELGTMLGYSALCMATVMGEESVLHSVERHPYYYQRALDNIKKIGMHQRIHIHLMEAENFLREANEASEEWDFVFIDADKMNYAFYYEQLFPYVREGGVMIADNALFHGEVLAEKKNKYAAAIHTFNTLVQEDRRVHNVLLPLRDGVQLIYKLRSK